MISKKIFYPALAIICAILLFSCYTERKAAKQVDNAYNKYEQMVAKKTRTWFPCTAIDTTVIIDTVYSKDSSAFFKAKLDSLLLVQKDDKDSISIIYKDTCKSVLDVYNKAYDLGYKAGFYQGGKDCTLDTIYIRTTRTITVEDSAKIREIMLASQKKQGQMQRKIDKQSFWLKFLGIAAGLLLLALIIAILIAKRK